MGSWADKARPIVAQVLAETAGQDERQIRKALAEAYPFGVKACWPYKAWLQEVRRQRGLLKKKPAAVDERQLRLLEE
jgi:hypothetical protein